MKEMDEKELQGINGGQAEADYVLNKYGNVQYVCACGKGYLTLRGWTDHVYLLKHKYAKLYEQKIKGKSSKGRYFGEVKVIKITKNRIDVKYPDGHEQPRYFYNIK